MTERFAASLALPGLSAKPCVLVLALVTLSFALLARTALARRRGLGHQPESGAHPVHLTRTGRQH